MKLEFLCCSNFAEETLVFTLKNSLCQVSSYRFLIDVCNLNWLLIGHLCSMPLQLVKLVVTC